MKRDIQTLLEQYAPKIFLYCARRLRTPQDAEDLSQEILLAILDGLRRYEIHDVERWVWRVAHNRLARHVKALKPALLSLEDCAYEPEERMEDDEALYGAAFDALHATAERRRVLLIDRYVHGMSYDEIAERHGLTVSAVTMRLHYGKKELKQRWEKKMNAQPVYDKVRWTISGNGSFDPFGYLGRQIPRAIAKAAYDAPLTVEEISMATGIPCLYIEDELGDLLRGEVLMKKGGKVQTSFILHTEPFCAAAEALLKKTLDGFLPGFLARLVEIEPELRGIGFYGCDGPREALWWWFIPHLVRMALDRARAAHGKSARGPFLPRKDGMMGWFIVSESADETMSVYTPGSNGYYREAYRFIYYWNGQYYDLDLMRYLESLEEREIAGLLDEKEHSAAAMEGLRLGLLKQEKERLVWNIPVFSPAQKERLEALCKRVAPMLAIELADAVEALYQLYVKHTPNRLHGQIHGVFGGKLGMLIPMITDRLVEEGELEAPEEGIPFVRQVFAII